MKFRIAAITAAAMLAGTWTVSASITGNPLTDGWTSYGNSLASGTYVTGSGNYGYEAFGAGLTVQAGSNLEISAGSLSWLAGDTVLGVGGIFQVPADPGWTISGIEVNSLLPTTSPYVGPKLQAKFGTESATWTTSTSAPGSGNGNSSSSSGGGRVQIRTSGYFRTGTPNPLQTEPWTWDGDSGQLLVLDKDSHILWDGDAALNKEVARMIWLWDDTLNQVVSWELLLNVSLLDRLYPDFSGLLPSIGDMAIMTVQPGDSGSYTDALVRTAEVPVPEPTTVLAGALLLLPFGMSTLRKLRNRRAA
ncbi:MAG: hypothetical protein KIS67_19545 [Verrucomicrobiae bacterium]|nr:hypothetical protein [Verrucomicrobiae bacterium]